MIAYFFSLIEGRSLLYDLKQYEQKVTKIKCKQKDAVISSWDAPTLVQRRVTHLKKFFRMAEVVRETSQAEVSWGEALSVRSIVEKIALFQKQQQIFILINSQPMSILHDYLMHFIMQRKTLEFHSQVQQTNSNFLVIIKTFSLQRHSFY